MEYTRTTPQPSLPTSPSHTHTYTNAIPLDSWSISRDNTTPLGSLCVHRPCQGYNHNATGLPVHYYDRDAPRIPLGSMCIHRYVPAHKPQIKMPPTIFFPNSGFYVFDSQEYPVPPFNLKPHFFVNLENSDSWSLSHLGYLYPGTTPVMIKLDHNRSCPWV